MRNCTNRGFTLTSAVGDFIFECDVPMSHAQLVRDTIMAAVFGCSTDLAKPPQPVEAQRWFREHFNGPAKDTHFTWRR